MTAYPAQDGAPGVWFQLPLLLLGALLVFVLPFFSPAHLLPTLSTTYSAGADNRVATLGLAFLSLCTCVATVLGTRQEIRSRAALAEQGERLTRLFLLLACGVVAAWTLLGGWAILRSGLRVGESNYFLEQSRSLAGEGLTRSLRIYRDIEFPYGPLLLEPPVWLWRTLGAGQVSLGACYVFTLAIFNVAGVALVWLLLNALPLGTRARQVLFGVCLLEALHPLFGPNYSLLKFAFPVVLVIFSARVKAPVWRSGAFAAGSFLTLMLSPELAVGVVAAMYVLVLVRLWLGPSGERWATALTGLAPLLGIALFVRLYGLFFLERLRHASNGALNLVIQPMPDVLVLCFAAMWLAPVIVGLTLRSAWRSGRAVTTAQEHGAGTLAAVWVLAVSMLPGALGRADALHVFYNGLPMLVLSCVALHRLAPRWQRVWLWLLVLLAVQVQVTNYLVYLGLMRDMARHVRTPVRQTIDINRLRQKTGGEAVSTPVLYAISEPDDAALRAAHLLVVDRTPGLAEIWDTPSEQQHVERMRESNWALVPEGDWRTIEGFSQGRWARKEKPLNHWWKWPVRVSIHALLGLQYPERHPPFVLGEVTWDELQANWQLVDTQDGLLLYRRVR